MFIAFLFRANFCFSIFDLQLEDLGCLKELVVRAKILIFYIQKNNKILST